MTIFLVSSLFMTLASVFLCHQVAKRRGLSPVFWGVMGATFGPFAIPFVFLVKAKKRVENES